MRSYTYRSVLVFLLLLPSLGCLFRSHPVARPITTAPAKTATQAELVNYINSQAAQIRTMQATVDIDTTVGGVKKGQVTDYQQIRGYVLARKPAMLRMIGLMPVVRNRAFDMVSNGTEFKLWVPPKNRFVIGKNDVQTRDPKQPLENVRPQHIYDAILLREIAPDEIAVMESDTRVSTDAKGKQFEEDNYVIDVIRPGAQGHYLSRKIIFSRVDLLPYRQVMYDENSNVATDAQYQGYKDYNGVNYPSRIAIFRPEEEYNIVLSIVKLELNQNLPDDKFQLEQPAGAQVVHLDSKARESRGGGSGSGR